MRAHSLLFLLLILVGFVTSSCHTVNDERIPAMPVRLTFHTQGDWIVHGVAGAGDYKIYNRVKGIPVDYPYTALDATGYGGVMVVCDVSGEYAAVDVACPVEASPDVTVYVPKGELYAQCPKCGSTFEVFSNCGYPRTGLAAERGYALTRYHVSYGGSNEYIVVTR